MTHNDVARRTARTMPARSLYRSLALQDTPATGGTALRSLERPLPSRALSRTSGGCQ